METNEEEEKRIKDLHKSIADFTEDVPEKKEEKNIAEVEEDPSKKYKKDEEEPEKEINDYTLATTYETDPSETYKEAEGPQGSYKPVEEDFDPTQEYNNNQYF